MEILELKPYGYCYGVLKAIELIKEIKNRHQNKNVYVFGMLVHNNDVVKYLEGLNIHTIDTNNKDKDELIKQFTNDDVVVFTAHGHDYKLEEILKKNNIIFYDAICRNVYKNVVHILKESVNSQVIYIGKKNHPETEASLKLSNNVVLYDVKEGIDYSKIIVEDPFITNQTTLSYLEIENIHKDILKHFPKARIIDEICSSTRIRQRNILTSNFDGDLIVIVGAIQSSNTDKLYQLAKEKYHDKKVIKVENLRDIKQYDLTNFKSCMIASGTSTPLESILEIKEYLGGLNNE